MPLHYRLVFCGNFHMNYKAICMNYDLNKCPVLIKSPVLFKSSPLLDRFISYALHFLCQVFIKLMPIFKAGPAVRALEQYQSNPRSSKLLKPHRTDSWRERDQKDGERPSARWIQSKLIFFFFYDVWAPRLCCSFCITDPFTIQGRHKTQLLQPCVEG